MLTTTVCCIIATINLPAPRTWTAAAAACSRFPCRRFFPPPRLGVFNFSVSLHFCISVFQPRTWHGGKGAEEGGRRQCLDRPSISITFAGEAGDEAVAIDVFLCAPSSLFGCVFLHTNLCKVRAAERERQRERERERGGKQSLSTEPHSAQIMSEPHFLPRFYVCNCSYIFSAISICVAVCMGVCLCVCLGMVASEVLSTTNSQQLQLCVVHFAKWQKLLLIWRVQWVGEGKEKRQVEGRARCRVEKGGRCHFLLLFTQCSCKFLPQILINWST